MMFGNRPVHLIPAEKQELKKRIISEALFTPPIIVNSIPENILPFNNQDVIPLSY
jgi:hypothetical protein